MTETMEKTVAFWNSHAERYSKSQISNMDGYRFTLDRTRSYLSPSDTVLELGAGTGSTALDLAPAVARITATDIAPEMSRIAATKARKQGVENVEFLTADATVPDLAGPYDAVLAHNLLHLVEDLPAVIARAHDLLKPGGVFISKTFCKPHRLGPPFYYWMRVLLPFLRLMGKAPFVALLTISELEEAITAGGFEIVEAENYPARDIRRYVVARKR